MDEDDNLEAMLNTYKEFCEKHLKEEHPGRNLNEIAVMLNDLVLVGSYHIVRLEKEVAQLKDQLMKK